MKQRNSFIGKNSFLFYVWHGLAFTIFELVTVDFVTEQYMIIILKMITSIIMLSILSIVISRYFRWVLERKKG